MKRLIKFSIIAMFEFMIRIIAFETIFLQIQTLYGQKYGNILSRLWLPFIICLDIIIQIITLYIGAKCKVFNLKDKYGKIKATIIIVLYFIIFLIMYYCYFLISYGVIMINF